MGRHPHHGRANGAAGDAGDDGGLRGAKVAAEHHPNGGGAHGAAHESIYTARWERCEHLGRALAEFVGAKSRVGTRPSRRTHLVLG